MMYLAFYGNRYGGLLNKAIRWWTSPLPYKLNGKWRDTFSHVEIVFSDGMMFSASQYENKVRFKNHSFTGKAWGRHPLDISVEDELKIRNSCIIRAERGEEYDYFGVAGFVLSAIPEDKDKSFCSEVCTAELQEYVTELKDLVPHKTSPNGMAIALKFGVFNV